MQNKESFQLLVWLPQTSANIHFQSWILKTILDKTVCVSVYVTCFFIWSIHAFDLKYYPFIFLYIFLLTVFIIMHENANLNREKNIWQWMWFQLGKSGAGATGNYLKKDSLLNKVFSAFVLQWNLLSSSEITAANSIYANVSRSLQCCFQMNSCYIYIRPVVAVLRCEVFLKGHWLGPYLCVWPKRIAWSLERWIC